MRIPLPSTEKILLLFATIVALLFAGTSFAQAGHGHVAGASPAVCGAGDMREPGIQGEVPAGQVANYNCGVKLIGQLPLIGNVQGAGDCAYIRPRGGPVHVIDMSNPEKPVEVTSVPVKMGSETMRTVVTRDRAILVSGSSVYDIRDCKHPVLKGEIAWPHVSVPGITVSSLPHDLRINHEANKIFAAFGLWEADIDNLDDPTSWKIIDHRCELAAQVPGPWQTLHQTAIANKLSLCADAKKPAPQGANYMLAASPLQASMIWPTLSHSPDTNAEDTRLYIGDQAGGTSGIWAPIPMVRIVDTTQTPFKILGEVEGGGHGLDWFRSGGREYVLHSNEVGNLAGVDEGDTCTPYPRSQALGWAFEAYVADVTDPKQASNISMLQIAINTPEFCQQRKASGMHPWIAYHLLDNAINPKFAAVNFGDAGLRIFDMRNPAKPVEVAYFNHGPLVHAEVGYYDARRGLIYITGGKGLSYDHATHAGPAATAPDDRGFWVLKIEPQVKKTLGL